MVMKLDQLVNGAINVGFGAAAVAVEGGKKVLDDLNTKGEQVRKDTDRDKILTAADAKEYGIIDTVLEYRKLSAQKA